MVIRQQTGSPMSPHVCQIFDQKVSRKAGLYGFHVVCQLDLHHISNGWYVRESYESPVKKTLAARQSARSVDIIWNHAEMYLTPPSTLPRWFSQMSVKSSSKGIMVGVRAFLNFNMIPKYISSPHLFWVTEWKCIFRLDRNTPSFLHSGEGTCARTEMPKTQRGQEQLRWPTIRFLELQQLWRIQGLGWGAMFPDYSSTSGKVPKNKLHRWRKLCEAAEKGNNPVWDSGLGLGWPFPLESGVNVCWYFVFITSLEVQTRREVTVMHRRVLHEAWKSNWTLPFHPNPAELSKYLATRAVTGHSPQNQLISLGPWSEKSRFTQGQRFMWVLCQDMLINRAGWTGADFILRITKPICTLTHRKWLRQLVFRNAATSPLADPSSARSQKILASCTERQDIRKLFAPLSNNLPDTQQTNTTHPRIGFPLKRKPFLVPTLSLSLFQAQTCQQTGKSVGESSRLCNSERSWRWKWPFCEGTPQSTRVKSQSEAIFSCISGKETGTGHVRWWMGRNNGGNTRHQEIHFCVHDDGKDESSLEQRATGYFGSLLLPFFDDRFSVSATKSFHPNRFSKPCSQKRHCASDRHSRKGDS